MNRIQQNIISDLKRIGISAGDILMLHSSFKALGQYDLTPDNVIDCFLSAIGENGTLLMPALTYDQEPHHIHNTFTTSSNVGVIPEQFRLRKNVLRSIHPTHSVCGYGHHAEKLLKDHEKDSTPCGEQSPFSKILDIDAKIVMLGCGLKVNTAMHALEEMIEPPYLFGANCEYQISTDTGEQYTKNYKKHSFEGWDQAYHKIAMLRKNDIFVKGNVLDAETYVINTQMFKEAVLIKLKEDKLYFVNKIV